MLHIISSIIIYPLLLIFRYRRRVVDDNLARAFPDLPKKRRNKIARQFYSRFADQIVDTLRLLCVSDKAMRRRVEWVDLDIISGLIDQNRDVAVYFSHCFNWEWAPSVTLRFSPETTRKVRFCQVYRPLKSKFFDRVMLRIRSRFGSVSLPKSSTLRSLISFRRSGLLSVTGFMSDQHPGHGDPGHLTFFLGQPTRMISGTETLARKLSMAVVYWDIERTARGRYRITTRLITDRPESLPPGEITERYTRMLENTIRRDPPNWLWSHNRWKNPVDPSLVKNHNTSRLQ